MTQENTIQVIPAGQAQATVDILALHQEYFVRTDDTASKIAVMEWSLPPKALGAPPHIHLADDEVFYVLEGELTVMEEGAVASATAGTTVILERGKLHTFWNASDKPVKALVILAPGHLEGFFFTASPFFSATEPMDMETINRIAQEHQLELRMDLVPEIMQKYGLGENEPTPPAQG